MWKQHVLSAVLQFFDNGLLVTRASRWLTVLLVIQGNYFPEPGTAVMALPASEKRIWPFVNPLVTPDDKSQNPALLPAVSLRKSQKHRPNSRPTQAVSGCSDKKNSSSLIMNSLLDCMQH